MIGFSEEALNSVHACFLDMIRQRGDWVREDQIVQYIKSAPWNAGAFIRKEFEFSNWFKNGHEYLYSKKDLIALGEQLMRRNIDLKRYRELLEDQTRFEKKIAALKKRKVQKPFQVPLDIRNITDTEIEKPNPEIIQSDLTRLKREFDIGNLGGYIDIYKGTHAMLRNFQDFEKYVEPGLKRRCRKWCDEFNYASRALELTTGKKEK
jgi:hypothetical protein